MFPDKLTVSLAYLISSSSTISSILSFLAAWMPCGTTLPLTSQCLLRGQTSGLEEETTGCGSRFYDVCDVLTWLCTSHNKNGKHTRDQSFLIMSGVSHILDSF